MKNTLIRWLTASVAATWRVRFDGLEHLSNLRAVNAPFVFALWHEHIVPLLWLHRGHATSLLVSGHGDAAVLTDAARRWGYEVIAGSSTRGGGRALRSAVTVLRASGELAIAPDGPTGPRRVAKRGIAAAARMAGAPILPLRIDTDRAWHLGTWDRMVIPKPFARVTVRYAPPVVVRTRKDEAEAVKAVERSLEATA